MKAKRTFGAISLVALLLSPLLASAADDTLGKRKSAASQLAKDIARLGIRRSYIPDFLDPSGRRTAAGSLFAAYFSKLTKEGSKKIEIANRIDVHRYLDQKGWSDSDLAKADVISSVASQFGVDSVLFGVISDDRSRFAIELTIRNLAGAELFRTQYVEKLDPSVLAALPFGAEQLEPTFYFAGLDGVTMPQCQHCPIPFYPESKRKSRVQGSVLLSVLVTPDGRTDRIYILRKLDPELDQDALQAVKSWRISPAKNSEGLIVRVRVPVEVTYRMY